MIKFKSVMTDYNQSLIFLKQDSAIAGIIKICPVVCALWRILACKNVVDVIARHNISCISH
jgi:hypothetical protein